MASPKTTATGKTPAKASRRKDSAAEAGATQPATSKPVAAKTSAARNSAAKNSAAKKPAAKSSAPSKTAASKSAASKPAASQSRAESGLATTSTRTLWKGAISFGLVHVPVGLFSATVNSGIDFDWLDKRSMDPVGYKRVNKVTGREVQSKDIVKGVEIDKNQYVVLSAEEIAAAYPKTTQTIEIEAFVDADEIPFVYLERPYYTAPLKRGEKVYALLREALRETGKVGLAKVVIQNRQHLAVLIPSGRAMVLNLLRWGGEIRSFEQLDLPPRDAKSAGIKPAEMTMAKKLIDDMTQRWDADQFRDSFSAEIMRLVKVKAEEGDIESVLTQAPEAPEGGSAQIVDLTALLKRSLGAGRPASDKPTRSGKRRSA